MSNARAARQLLDGKPRRFHRLPAGGDLRAVGAHERVVRDDGGLDLPGRVAELERVELLEIRRAQRRLLEELAPGRLVERLVAPQLAAGQRPVSGERLDGATHEQDLQARSLVRVGADAEDDDRDHDGRLRAGGLVGAASDINAIGSGLVIATDLRLPQP